MYTHCSFDNTKNKLDFYRGEDCMKKFSDSLKDHLSKIITYEQKELIKLTEEEYENHKNQKVCYICKKEFSAYDEDKNYCKVKHYCYFTCKYQDSCHKICRSKCKSLKEIPIVFHNGSTYDYHFIINELATSFKEYGNFECVSENSKKYIKFSVPFKKDLKNGKSIKYKLKFIDSFRFMATSLSNLVNNLSSQLYNNCKNCTDCKNPLDYMVLKNKELVFKMIITKGHDNHLNFCC